MMKRLLLSLVAVLGLVGVAEVQPAHSQAISQRVAVCNPAYTTRCVAPDVNGAIPVTVSGVGASSVYGPDATNVAPTQPPILGGCLSTTSGAPSVSVTRVQYVTCDLFGRAVVAGGAANGSPTLGNPVLVAGSDGLLNARTLLTDTSGRQVISGAGIVSTANSSTATLGSAGVFTGTSEDISAYSSVTVTVFANVASAANGLSIQQSSDGTNWDVTDTYTISASTTRSISVPVFARFFRVVYTNGGSAQGSMRLQTIYHTVQPWGSSVKATDGTSLENDSQLVTNFNMLKNSSANATADIQRSITGVDTVGTGVSAVATAPHSIAGGALTPTVTSAVASSLVLKASAGNLYGFSITSGASAGYVMVFNATTAPADGAVTPQFCSAIAANASLNFDMTTGNIPERFTTGITLVFSTTGCFTKTASATAYMRGKSQ